jgi:hypothetical protein
MRTFILPTKDTSIYQVYPNNNAGHDEILEVGKLENTGDYYPVRGLIYFDLAGQIPSGSSANLRLYIASMKDLHSSQVLNLYPLVEEWDEGTSYFYQTPYNVRDGATWNSASVSSEWLTTGSTYLPSVSASSTLSSQPLTDVTMDITNIVTDISQSDYPNYGFVLKLDDATENSVSNKANCKFFSKQTHTIFQPTIEILLDNETYVTGSLKVLTSSSAEIATTTLKNHYEKGEKDMIRFLVRDKYPPKVFDLSARYKAKYALPRNTFFEIKDLSADVVVYPADQYDRLSCDANGSYFILDTSHLYRNREYGIRLKVEYGIETEYVNVGEFRVK